MTPCGESGRVITSAERSATTGFLCKCGRRVNGTYNRFKRMWVVAKHNAPTTRSSP